MRHVQGNVYAFSISVYYDALNADPAVINDDPTVTLNIFSRTNNRLIRRVTLPRISNELVNYTVPACATGSRVVTRRFFYGANVELNPNEFAEAGGYYIAWERCCRNGIIDNILSPGNTGQAFYMEFPPLIRNGVRFINSAPALFQPVADYACVNQPFTYNFGGTDQDGDQIVYSLRSPIRGFSSMDQDNTRPVNPGPYPDVRWAAGFGVNNMVPGAPALTINQTTGVLNVTPSRTGVFVFGIRAEEFRNGVKIGEVVREYQLVVLNCALNRPPVTVIEDPARPGVALTDNDTIYFQIGQPNRCANLVVTDPDPRTVISATVTPIGFALPSPLPAVQVINLPNGGTGRTQACFPECPPGRPATQRQAYSFDVLVADNGCAQPLTNRRRINVVYLPRPNAAPVVRTSLTPYDSVANEYAVTINVGEPLRFTATATDPNSDRVNLTVTGLAEALGATFNAPAAGPSPLTGNFSWTPPCNFFAPGQTERQIVLRFASADQAPCLATSTGFTTVRITVRNRRPVNSRPVPSTPLRFDATNRIYFDTLIVGRAYSFNVFGRDADNDSLVLSARGVGFDLAALRMQFPNASGRPLVTGTFRWTPGCDAIPAPATSRTFELDFRAQDFDRCGGNSTDSTVRVRLVVINRPNQRPTVVPTLRFDAVNRVYFDTVAIGGSFNFPVRADDPDRDSLLLQLQGLGGINPTALGMVFPDLRGRGTLNGNFRWTPRCDALSPTPNAPRTFNLRFRAQDIDPCGNSRDSVVQVRLVVTPRRNQRPTVLPGLAFDARTRTYVDSVVVGNAFAFTVRGDDPDRDSIVLQMQGVGINPSALGMVFPTLRGRPVLNGNFRWPTTCSILTDSTRAQDFLLNFIVTDFDPCGVPTSDTARVRLRVLPNRTVNRPPVTSTPLPLRPGSRRQYVDTVNVGDRVNFTVLATDADIDSLRLIGVPLGFDFAAVGMQFREAFGRGQVRTPLTWSPLCDLLPTGSGQRTFDIDFISRDFKECIAPARDTISVRLVLRVRPGANATPRVDVDPAVANTFAAQPGSPRRLRRTVQANSAALNFNILGTDADNDSIFLSARPIGFTLAEAGMSFRDQGGLGRVSSPFAWNPTCARLGPNFSAREFNIDFIVRDFRSCGANATDTLRLTFQLQPPAINPPRLAVTQGSSPVADNTLYDLRPDDVLSLALEAVDPDNFTVNITGTPTGFNFADFGIQFSNASGQGTARTNFVWRPTCGMLAQFNNREVEVVFGANDTNPCGPNQATAPLRIRLRLRDANLGPDFQPANVFTPNGDGKNDTFRIPGLPARSCTDEFIRIDIFNRWGARVFESTSNTFEWTGEGYPPGTYFYLLTFRTRQLKGTVTMLSGE
jgi:gliding motility-associated-like protein